MTDTGPGHHPMRRALLGAGGRGDRGHTGQLAPVSRRAPANPAETGRFLGAFASYLAPGKLRCVLGPPQDSRKTARQPPAATSGHCCPQPAPAQPAAVAGNKATLGQAPAKQRRRPGCRGRRSHMMRATGPPGAYRPQMASVP